jgi:hypothetical protein
MSPWSTENIIDICLLPAYGFLLFVNTYNLWVNRVRREYVLLFMSSSCISPDLTHPIELMAVEILGLTLKLSSVENSLVPFSVQWGLAISNLAFYPLMLACTVALEKWYGPQPHKLMNV